MNFASFQDPLLSAEVQLRESLFLFSSQNPYFLSDPITRNAINAPPLHYQHSSSSYFSSTHDAAASASVLHCNVLEALTRETLPNKIPSCYLVLLPGLIAMGPYVQLTTPLPIVVEVFPPPVLL